MDTAQERRPCDLWVLGISVFLLLLGTAIVQDASYARALHSPGLGAFYYFKKQAMWCGISLVVLLVGMRFPYWRLRSWWFVAVVAAMALLVLVLLVGPEVNGAKRWIFIGPFSFQPSEFAKIALVIFLAHYSEIWRSRVAHFWKGFLPPVLVVLALGGLVAKEDLGTAISLVATGLIMLAMMGARPAHLALVVAAAVGAGVGLVLLEPYRIDRIEAWIDLVMRPLEIHDGPAYQPAQGLIALGSGGVWGQGPMRGIAKHLYLPAEHTDYIFATVGEEFGLWGCLLLVGLFFGLVISGLTVAHRTTDWFGSLLAAGLTTMIGIQALLNIAVVTGLVPCTGVPLPFISYGGTSLVFTTVAVSIILNVSQHPNLPAEAVKVRRARESRADRWRNGRAHLSGT